jgi:ATP-dependent Clp protease protease subunit
MFYNKYLLNPYLNNEEGDEDNSKEEKEPMSPQMMKKMEKLFFEKRAVYLWGPVDDKSARDLVSKILLLDAPLFLMQ